MSQDDWLLMHRVADGDEGAVAELYDRFGSLVYKVARQLLPSRAEAEDAVQEVFIRLWQTADRYDPRRAKLVTWVMLIARRHLIDRLRRNAERGTTGTFQPDAPDPEPFARRFDLLTLTRKAKDHARFLYAAETRGERGFLRYLPTTVRILRAASARAARRDPRLAPLAELIDGLEESPCAR